MTVPGVETLQRTLQEVRKRIEAEASPRDSLEAGLVEELAQCTEREHDKVPVCRVISLYHSFGVFHVQRDGSFNQLVGIRVGPRRRHSARQKQCNGEIGADVRSQDDEFTTRLQDPAGFQDELASIEEVLQDGQPQYAVELSVIERKGLIEVALANVESTILRFPDQVGAPFHPVILGGRDGSERAQCFEITAIVGTAIEDRPAFAEVLTASCLANA